MTTLQNMNDIYDGVDAVTEEARCLEGLSVALRRIGLEPLAKELSESSRFLRDAATKIRQAYSRELHGSPIKPHDGLPGHVDG